MADRIDYQALVHDAMRGLVARVLADVARHGLPGAHHFFIALDTAHDGVEMARWLRAQYPAEMTIVLQHWFDGLTVGPESFTVTLNFGNRPETLTVPFAAIRTFVDPSAGFGLRFDEDEDEEADRDASDANADAEAPFVDAAEAPAVPQRDAEIVSLDKFRK
jgi:uncharacterized protein